MCLAVPVMITRIDGVMAEVDAGGVSRDISLQLVPEAKVGDYVLLHTGFAITILDEQEALETLALFREIAEHADDEATDAP